MQVHDLQGTLHTLAARMVYLARACGPVIARPGPQGEQAPLEAHDEQVRHALSALLQRPWGTAARRQARETRFEASVFVQAALPLRVALAKARAPGAGVASSISQCHTPCQGEALGIDPSMSDIPYIET